MMAFREVVLLFQYVGTRRFAEEYCSYNLKTEAPVASYTSVPKDLTYVNNLC
jgi:hypothetical protein